MLRIGILGTGWVVRKHVEAARLIPDMEIVAIASREGERAKAAAAQFQIPRAHAGYEALVADAGVDVVINALFDIGCYCVNLSRAVAGGEPVRATGHAHFDKGVDLTLAGMLEFPDNVTAQFCCSMESEPSWGVEIIGTEGRILVPNPWMPPE